MACGRVKVVMGWVDLEYFFSHLKKYNFRDNGVTTMVTNFLLPQ